MNFKYDIHPALFCEQYTEYRQEIMKRAVPKKVRNLQAQNRLEIKIHFQNFLAISDFNTMALLQYNRATAYRV